ncbi:MAG: hypothetical protein ABIY35_04505 [Chitinophagaceae bacterium]
MKIILSFLLSFALFTGSKTDSKSVLKIMHDKYAGKWYTSFTFIQTTERYRNDSLINTQTWYEALHLPYSFRIDFGDIKDGNAVIFSRDSMYIFRNDSLKRTDANNDDLTFLLGGMYIMPFDSVTTHFQILNYDLNKFHEDTFMGNPVYVIGADKAGEKVNQIWIDKNKLVLLRFIEYADGRKSEGIFENHKQFGGGWSEQKCSFYFDDKLAQVEYYHDCKANVSLDDAIFDPAMFGKVHWYQKN